MELWEDKNKLWEKFENKVNDIVRLKDTARGLKVLKIEAGQVKVILEERDKELI